MDPFTIAALAAAGIGGIAGAIKGAKREREARKQQAALRAEMEGRNNSAYMADYYGDYLKRADAQNTLRQARTMMQEQAKRDQNSAVITGATPEASAAQAYNRNRVLAGMIGNLGAMGAQIKDRARNRYLAGAAQTDAMANQEYARQAASGNNLMYNGIKMLGNMLPLAAQLFPAKAAGSAS